MPEDLTLKRDAWTQSIDQIDQLALSHGLSEEELSRNQFSTELAISNNVNEADATLQNKHKSDSRFEKLVRKSIEDIESLRACSKSLINMIIFVFKKLKRTLKCEDRTQVILAVNNFQK
jgi:hypothetical protein